MVFALFTEVHKFYKIHDRISRNRNHQAYSAEGFYLGCLKRLATLVQAILNRKFVDGKCLNCLLYIASPHFFYLLNFCIYIISKIFLKVKFFQNIF